MQFLLVAALSASWFYATLALCVATYTVTAALVSMLVMVASVYVALYAPRPGELPQYAALEDAVSRLLVLAPPRRLVELWVLGPSVGFVVALVAVSADGRFHASFAMLVLATVLVIGIPALGGEGVMTAIFTATAWWFALCPNTAP